MVNQGATPHTPHRGREIALQVLRVADDGLWKTSGLIARHPAVAAGLVAVAPVTPWLTISNVATLIGVGMLGLGVSLGWDAATRRSRVASLTEQVKHRTRIRRLRSRWVTICRDAKLVRPGTEGGKIRVARLGKPMPTDHGLTTTVYLSSVGGSVKQLRDAIPVIVSATGALSARITETRPGVATLDLFWTDPLGQTLTWCSLPHDRGTGTVMVGRDETGLPISIDPALPNLIVGAQGSGKSCLVWSTLAGLQAAGVPHRLRIMDPKGGMEFGQLADVAHDYEDNPLRWAKLIHRIVGAMVKRQRELKARGVREWKPSQREPLDLLVVDELLTILAVQKSKVKVGSETVNPEELFVHLLSQGRAAGYSVIALTQDGTKETIGPVRELFSYRTCLRVMSEAMVDVVLGSGARTTAPAHLLPARKSAGVGFMHDGSEIRRFRAALLDRRDMNSVIRGLTQSNPNQTR